MLGTRSGQRFADASGIEHVHQHAQPFLVAHRARVEVPLRADLHRVDLAGIQVIHRERQRIGRDEVQVALLRGAQDLCAAQLVADGGQRSEVVIARIEAVGLEVGECDDELVETDRIGPAASELALLVHARDRIAQDHARAMHIGQLGITQAVDVLADRLRDRIAQRLRLAEGECRLQRRAEQQRSGEAHHAAATRPTRS